MRKQWQLLMQKSGRAIIMERLNKEIMLAVTGDLHRAADFLEGARKIRSGSKRQRNAKRQAMREANIRKVDRPISW